MGVFLIDTLSSIYFLISSIKSDLSNISYLLNCWDDVNFINYGDFSLLFLEVSLLFLKEISLVFLRMGFLNDGDGEIWLTFL